MSSAPSTNCAFSGRNLSQVSRAIEYEPARHERVALRDRVFHHITSAWNSAGIAGARSLPASAPRKKRTFRDGVAQYQIDL